MKRQVLDFGSAELVNEFVFHNYPSSVAYFDEDLEKTALYLDTLSSNDQVTTYMNRTQNYELYPSVFLPCYAFKQFCSGSRALGARNEYPRELRAFFAETKKHEAEVDRLLDFKRRQKGYKRVKAADEERYSLAQHSSIQGAMKREDFKRDVLPYLFQMVHPNVGDKNTQLFSKFEKVAFQTAIELMVVFGLVLKQADDAAVFEPDLGALVQFEGGRKEFMRAKTQILILQNYEQVRQRMLTAGDPADGQPSNKNKAVMDAKLSGYGFLAGPQKKRKREEMEVAGRFMYKFKEGHSKNFRRELCFDYFLA